MLFLNKQTKEKPGHYFVYNLFDIFATGFIIGSATMFKSSKIGFDMMSIKHMVNGEMKLFYEPEMHLTNAYLREKYQNEFDSNDGIQMMVDNFEIIDLENLKPYKVVANVYNKVWESNYIPEDNLSLSNINQLLQPPPF